MEILSDFRTLHQFYTKKYKNQISFKSARMVKNSKGEMEPVFYIGVPGLMVAITLAFVMIATVYLLTIPFNWMVWVPYIIGLIFLFRISMKLDKAKQIRHMVYYLLDNGLKTMEQMQESKNEEDKDEYRKKALDWLEKAEKWVDEAALKAQIDTLKG
jgi:uncharacterized protein YacL